jgi:trimeric autotransporter adhesin
MASKSYRKFMATGLSAAVVASVVAPVAGAASYTDVKAGSWYEGAVNFVTEAGYMSGTDKGFEPSKTMTRAQAATLFANILGIYDDSLKADFSDVKEGAWYYNAVAAVKEHGIMSGTGTAFAPDRQLTRGEVAALVVRAYGIELTGASHSFTDVDGNMFENEIAILAELGIANGTNGGETFEPGKVITRAEMAAFIQKTEEVLYGTPAVAVSSVEVVDNTTIHVTFDGTLEEVSKEDFAIEGLEILDAQILVEEVAASEATTTVVLTTSEQVAGTEYTLSYKGEVVVLDAPIVGVAPVVKVASVSAITTTFAEVEFSALVDVWEDATVEVKDGNGNVVEVKTMDLAKGSTVVQFDFVTPVDADDLTGVWTVNGVEYSFTELELVADINAAAAVSNQVALYNALLEASVANVDVDLIADYVTAISTASPQAVWLEDVQTIIDEANEAASDAASDAEKVAAVVDAVNQVELLQALETNFVRVNSDWITGYSAELVNGTGMLALAGTAGYANTVADIQAAIDAENATQITAAESAADTAAEQANVTTLIQLYTEDDVAPATTKVDAIEASRVKEAVLRVKETSTQNSTYNALVNLSNLDDTTSALNSNLTTFYFVEQQKSTTQTALNAKTVVSVNTNVIAAADSAALTNAMTEVTTTFTALNADNTNATKKTNFKNSLVKLANYTSHKTGTAKFDLTTVSDANLVAYAVEFANTTAISNSSTVADVAAKINSVNATEALDESIATVNDVDASVTDVRTALTNIVIASQPLSAGTTDEDWINLSAQAKLEVAALVTDARIANGSTDFVQVDILNAADGTGVIRTAIDAHSADLADFNAIGDLSVATTSTTKAALDVYAYDSYVALTASEKIAVAEYINSLVKLVGNPAVETPLNFLGVDAVTTLAEANAYIDTAIAAVK